MQAISIQNRISPLSGALASKVHDSVKQLQTSLAVQRPRPCAHDLEIVEQIGFNAGEPRPRRSDTVCFHRKGQVFGFHIPVVAAFKLPFEDAGIFLSDRV